MQKRARGERNSQLEKEFKKMKEVIGKKPNPTLLLNGNDVIQFTKSDKNVGEKLNKIWKEIFWKNIYDKDEILRLIAKTI
jgi:hypothetical protein